MEIPLVKSDTALVWIFSQCSDVDPILSKDEQVRADSFLVDGSRRQFVFTRTNLRSILGFLLGIDPIEVKIKIGEWGKPFLSEYHRSDFQFNVSHSSHSAAIVVGREMPVGIDVEEDDSRSAAQILSVVSEFLSDVELAGLEKNELGKRKGIALRNWVIKESNLKAIGSGLMRNPKSIEIVETGNEGQCNVTCGEEPLLTHDLKTHFGEGNGGIIAAVTLHRSVEPKIIRIGQVNRHLAFRLPQLFDNV